MKILAIDSSGLTATVALVEEGQTLAEYSMSYKKTHSQTLLPMIDQMMKMIELSPSEIDAIAVAGGPGSFTGLRIGSATAKGLGLALNKPLIHVPTLDAMAYNLYGCEDIICPIMDARRQQVYAGIYTFSSEQGDGGERVTKFCTLEGQEALPMEELIVRLNERGGHVIFLGDGVPVHRELIEQKMEVPYSFAPLHMNRQRAASVGALGLFLYQSGQYESAEAHRPDYLRVSQAERERAKREEQASVTVRGMTVEDAAAVAEMEHQIFAEPWSEKSIVGTLSTGGNICLVAERAGQRVGYLLAYTVADEAEIARIAVLKEMRRQGIAGLLMAGLKEACVQGGKVRILLDVRQGNEAARKLYGKEGFVMDGIRPGYYDSPKEDGVLMSLFLGK